MAYETNVDERLSRTKPANNAGRLLHSVPAWLRSARDSAFAVVRKRPRLSAALAAIVLGLGAYLAINVESSSEPEYTTATVVKGNIEDSVTAVGNLQPRDYVDVGAQVSGQLKKLYVDIGDKVTKGQLLAEIDPQVLNSKVDTDKANLANLQAQLNDRRAQLALAQADYARQQRLKAADATSQSAYDAARQAMNSASAQVNAVDAQIKASQSTLDGDQATLSYTKIYSPMDGTVASITTKQGMTVNANQQAPIILRVADLSTMTVWTQVSEADVPKLKLGMPAYFTTLGNPDKRWYGKLTQIQPTPTVTNNVVLYTATFDVSNPDGDLMTQMTAQVFFVTASAQNVLTVPVSALHQGRRGTRGAGARAGGTGANGSAWRASGAGQQRRTIDPAVRAAIRAGAKRYTVQVVQSDGTIERRLVAIGVSNRVTAQVVAGLKEGETVVAGVKSADTGSRAQRSGSGRSGNGPGGNRGFGGGAGPRIP